MIQWQPFITQHGLLLEHHLHQLPHQIHHNLHNLPHDLDHAHHHFMIFLSQNSICRPSSLWKNNFCLRSCQNLIGDDAHHGHHQAEDEADHRDRIAGVTYDCRNGGVIGQNAQPMLAQRYTALRKVDCTALSNTLSNMKYGNVWHSTVLYFFQLMNCSEFSSTFGMHWIVSSDYLHVPCILSESLLACAVH